MVVNKKYHIDDLLPYKDLLTPKQIEAAELHKKGLSYIQMSEMLCITPEAVSYRLVHARRRIARSKGMSTIEINPQLKQGEIEVLELRNQGFRYKEIAKKLGISEKTVGARLTSARKRIKAKELQSGQ